MYYESDGIMCALELIAPDGVLIVFMILLFCGYYNAWVTVQKKVSVLVVFYQCGVYKLSLDGGCKVLFRVMKILEFRKKEKKVVVVVLLLLLLLLLFFGYCCFWKA